MNGKIVSLAILGAAALAGAGLYYLQVFHFYQRLDPGEVAINMVGQDAPLPVARLEAIDATSSPIRFRACFTLDATFDFEGLQPYGAAEPLNAPFWFDCFDAAEIGAAVEAGQAQAFLAQAEIAHGVDRVVAVFADGRGYAWHQLNPEFAE
ncbi:MAG: DUF6446 family protein [Mangrovicoccus sp.]|nr:DUF6446 family protein [Mangrovicoccus sp.]